MMKYLMLLISLTSLAAINLMSGTAFAAQATASTCRTQGTGIINAQNLPHACADQSTTLNSMLDIGFAVIGAVAILMVVIAGFRYIRAGSNETIVAESKRQLMHAIVGLLVVAFAAAIVNFALARVNL